MIKREDILTSNLCDEIDDLRADVRYWKEQSEYWRVQHGNLVQESIKNSQRMMGDLLIGAMKGCFHPPKE